MVGTNLNETNAAVVLIDWNDKWGPRVPICGLQTANLGVELISDNHNIR